MSYQALYRKYRPSTLNDVIGQDIVIKILKNAVINNKVGHAYLFSGPRGIGKTTIAKALAKTVNCTDLIDGVSCEKCDNCASINSGFNPDIIEIDAASNNGVDEIREIKNKINLVPNQLKYKVYIIDEVHMLSIGAFNALLKTLEEPPEHIIFILATTDPQKVPATIVSRCQCFEFHRISNKDIVERLKYIVDNEKIEIDDDVLEMIADLSDGGLRDAVGMLDKLNAYSNSKITLEDFEKVNGIVSLEEKEKFLTMLFDGNVVEVINFIDTIYDNGKDLIIFSQNLLDLCKKKSIEYYVNNMLKYDIDNLIKFSEILNDLLREIKNTSNVKTLFEIKLLSFMNNKNNKNVVKQENFTSPVENVNVEKEVKIISQEIISTEKEEKKVEKNETVDEVPINNNEIIINNCFARANKNEKKNFEDKWSSLGDYALDNVFGAVASFLTDGTVRAVGTGEVIISFDYESMASRGLNLLDSVQKLFEKVYNKYYDVAFITTDEWNRVKQEFIENKNKGVNYEYKPLPQRKLDTKKTSGDDSITSQAMALFGDDVISVN